MEGLDRRLRVIPLGGLGEFGMNLMLYELPDSMIVVDCGMMFPDASVLGVDVVIPDFTYVVERREKLAAIFLTHGHEDHIGAVPFLLAHVNVPVYGSPLTLGFVGDKLNELGMSDGVELRLLTPKERVVAGSFEIEPIHVTHSIIDALAFAIKTPFGVVLHTGDFKFDPTPIEGPASDLESLTRIGEAGTLLLVSDSTNAIVEGSSPSERMVGETLTRIFTKTIGRIIVTTFASHIHRIQQLIDLAIRFDRKVYFVGRSVIGNVETAERLGRLRIPRFVRGKWRVPDDGELARQTLLITTGTQGEPTSALARMALDQHKHVHLRRGDLVIISARTIPGNERAVSHVIDHLFRRGAEVIYDEVPDIHVSGHAARDELATMINLTRPRFFIPMHGSYRHLVRHAQVAERCGIEEENIFVITNGEVVELDRDRGRRLEGKVAAGKVFIDQQAEEVPSVVVRDRLHLAEDGFVIVVVALRGGLVAREPEIITRGVVHVDASAAILEEVRDLLLQLLSEAGPEELEDVEIVQEKMRAVLKRYFRKKLNRRPMILPVVWEM